MNIVVTSTASKSPNFVGPAVKDVAHGMLSSVLTFWPVWLVVGLVLLGRFVFTLTRLRRLSQSGIRDVDRMSGREFESYLGSLFPRLGYSAHVTPHQGDYGADLLVTKDGKRIAVQAKRWKRPIGVSAVQQVVAARGYHGCDSALVVANRAFTQAARGLARANGVELWDRDVLISKMIVVRGQIRR
jgi:restriction system protein